MSVFIQIDLPDRAATFKRRALTPKGTYATAALEQLEAAYREARDWLVAQGAKSPDASRFLPADARGETEWALQWTGGVGTQTSSPYYRREHVPNEPGQIVRRQIYALPWEVVSDNSEKGAGDG